MGRILHSSERHMDTFFTKNRGRNYRSLSTHGQRHDSGFKKAQKARSLREKQDAREYSRRQNERNLRRIAEKIVTRRHYGSSDFFGYGREVNDELERLTRGDKESVSTSLDNVFYGLRDFPSEVSKYAGIVAVITDPRIIVFGGIYKLADTEHYIELQPHSGLVQVVGYNKRETKLKGKKVDSGIVSHYLETSNIGELKLKKRIYSKVGLVRYGADKKVLEVQLWSKKSSTSNDFVETSGRVHDIIGYVPEEPHISYSTGRPFRSSTDDLKKIGDRTPERRRSFFSGLRI